MRYVYQVEQWVPYPVELVFAFFANPENLPRLMPAWQRPRIEEASYVTPPPYPVAAESPRRFSSFAAGAGSQFTITFRPFPYSPIRLKWEAYIAEFAWNDHFCDEQRSGPFGYWRHCHRVARETRSGIEGTNVEDYLIYELPFSLLSRQANALFIGRQIRRIFAFRQANLEEHLQHLAQQFQRDESR